MGSFCPCCKSHLLITCDHVPVQLHPAESHCLLFEYLFIRQLLCFCVSSIPNYSCCSLNYSVRVETIKINWGAYPHYHAPEVYAPFILDGKRLYYVNAFENAASTMETSAVAAENIARLILSRLSGKANTNSPKLKSISNDSSELHSEL